MQVYNDPYRLFNLDVHEFKVNTTYLGLYGSVPFLISYSKAQKGNVGIYWANAAETWVDIYTSENQDQSQKRGAVWSSETNVLEFFIFISKDPK